MTTGSPDPHGHEMVWITSSHLDPLQLAYQVNQSTGDHFHPVPSHTDTHGEQLSNKPCHNSLLKSCCCLSGSQQLYHRLSDGETAGSQSWQNNIQNVHSEHRYTRVRTGSLTVYIVDTWLLCLIETTLWLLSWRSNSAFPSTFSQTEEGRASHSSHDFVLSQHHWEHCQLPYPAWFGNSTVEERYKLNRIVKTAEKFIGASLPHLSILYGVLHAQSRQHHNGLYISLSWPVLTHTVGEKIQKHENKVYLHTSPLDCVCLDARVNGQLRAVSGIILPAAKAQSVDCVIKTGGWSDGQDRVATYKKPWGCI